MLILRRKAGESIVIGNDVLVTVVDINEGSIRLAIEAPKEIPILRSELVQAADENRIAAQGPARPERLARMFSGTKRQKDFPRGASPAGKRNQRSAPEGVSAAPAADEAGTAVEPACGTDVKSEPGTS